MKSVHIGLIRLLQFVNILVFTFVVLVYFGVLILLPLDIFFQLARLLKFLPLMIEVFVAGGIVGYLVYSAYRMPFLTRTLVDGGVELGMLGMQQNSKFQEFVEQVRQSA